MIIDSPRSPCIYRNLASGIALRWLHNERDGVSNHQLHECLLNLLFRRRSKKTAKLRVTGFCEGNSPVTGEFPAQRATIAENVSIWWLHHGLFLSITFLHIEGCMCWTGPFEFRWLKVYIHNPSYYHHQIGSIHLSHCCHIFPWLCVWDGCTIIFCHLLRLYPGKTGTLFPFLMFSLWFLQTSGYIMAGRSCSFVCRLHHLIIIIMHTYLKALNY